MTTVCYKNGVMAVDSQVSANGAAIGYADKCRKLDDGSIVAHGGILADATVVFDWMASGEVGESKPVVDDKQFEAVRVYRDGSVYWYSSNLVAYQYQSIDDFWAFGTGEHFALGAMAFGASAEDACKIACQFDVNSGGPIKVLTLGLWQAGSSDVIAVIP